MRCTSSSLNSFGRSGGSRLQILIAGPVQKLQPDRGRLDLLTVEHQRRQVIARAHDVADTGRSMRDPSAAGLRNPVKVISRSTLNMIADSTAK